MRIVSGAVLAAVAAVAFALPAAVTSSVADSVRITGVVIDNRDM